MAQLCEVYNMHYLNSDDKIAQAIKYRLCTLILIFMSQWANLPSYIRDNKGGLPGVRCVSTEKTLIQEFPNHYLLKSIYFIILTWSNRDCSTSTGIIINSLSFSSKCSRLNYSTTVKATLLMLSAVHQGV